MGVPSDRLSMDMAVNSPRAARVQHEYFLDNTDRLSPSAWAILFLAILGLGLLAWYLTR
jgi:hypothetical protein